jgi:hypothetical protein
VSLLLSEREKQQITDDHEKLALANDWRRLRGLPPANSLEEAYKLATKDKPAKASDFTAAGTDTDVNTLEPDVLLQETAQITADMAILNSGSMQSLAKKARI